MTNNKSAKALFAEIGYIEDEYIPLGNETRGLTYKKDGYSAVTFFAEEKRYATYTDEEFHQSEQVSVPLHNAIHQQLKEFGWV